MCNPVLIFICLALDCSLANAQKKEHKLVGKRKTGAASLKPAANHTLDITVFAHGFQDSTWLCLDDANSLGNATDSALLINERVHFKVKKDICEKYRPLAIRTKSFSDYKIFWLENHPISFSAVKGNFKSALINGSTFQLQLEVFDRLTIPLKTEIDSLRRNFGNTDSVVWKKIISLEEELKEISIQFVKENANANACAYLLSVYGKSWGAKTSRLLYNNFSENKETKFGIAVKKFIDLNKEVEVGSTYVDFRQPSHDGVTLSLSSLAGEYILLEFWASWCGPCRKENPNLLALYNKYQKRGFKIFAVSLDGSAAAWKKAIADDKLTWPNVSQLTGGDNDAALIYGIYEIPSNFLIDPGGKIIAKNLRGAELNKKLKELLGY